MSPLKSKLFSVLTSRQWWLQSLRAAVAYAPTCALAAIGLALGNVLLIAGTQKLYQILQMQEITSDVFLKLTGTGCMTVLGGFVAISWALASWLVHLTAFSRAYWQGEGKLDAALIKRSLAEVRAKKGYLCKVWAVASVYMIIPIFPLMLLSVCRILSSPEYASLGLAPVAPSGWTLAFINLSILVVVAVVTGYSLVLVAMSSSSLAEAGQTAWQALKFSWSKSGRVLAVTFLVLFINAVVSAPQSLLGGGSPEEAIKQNLMGYIAWQCWFAFSSAILWPWSLAPFCEILKESESAWK